MYNLKKLIKYKKKLFVDKKKYAANAKSKCDESSYDFVSKKEIDTNNKLQPIVSYACAARGTTKESTLGATSIMVEDNGDYLIDNSTTPIGDADTWMLSSYPSSTTLKKSIKINELENDAEFGNDTLLIDYNFCKVDGTKTTYSFEF